MQKKFSIGDNFGMIIDNNGFIKSFGRNSYGCLGIGSDNNYYDKPVDVIDLPKDIKCVSINAGKNHSLALFENGDVYGWGYSYYGQLGDDTRDDRLSPFKVIGLPKDIKPVKVIAAADSSIVLLENGDLYATGKIVDSLVFVPYKLSFKVKDVEFLYGNSDNGLVLLDKDNKIFISNLGQSHLDWCEHDKDAFFQPKGLHENSIVKKIITGSNYLFILTKNNTLYSIGSNKDGQLGLDSDSDKESFSKVYGLKGNIKQVRTTHDYSSSFVTALTDDSLYGWGENDRCQLGEQKDHYTTYFETGIIFKDRHHTNHYVERKPKVLEEFSDLIDITHDIEIACGNGTSYIYDFTISKLYKFSSPFSDTIGLCIKEKWNLFT